MSIKIIREYFWAFYTKQHENEEIEIGFMEMRLCDDIWYECTLPGVIELNCGDTIRVADKNLSGEFVVVLNSGYSPISCGRNEFGGEIYEPFRKKVVWAINKKEFK